MQAVNRWAIGLFSVIGCGAAPERSPAPPVAPPPVDAGSQAVLAPALPPPVPPASSAPTHFTLRFDGACVKARVGHLGAEPAYVFEQNVSWFDGNEPRELYRDKNVAHMYMTHSFVGAVGGPDPAHAWIVRYTPSRGEGHDGSILFAAKGWKDAAYAKGASAGNYYAESPIEQPDGSLWAYATEAFYSEDASTNHFVAWSAAGDLLDTHLPRGDMQNAQRLGTGELVTGSRSKKNKVVLRRWSPARAVADLVAEDSVVVDSYVETRLGNERAVLATEVPKGKLAFYTYQGDVLAAVPLPVPVSKSDSWLVTRSDDLFVTSGEELVIHRRDGRIEREPVPEPGALAGDSAHVWWMGRTGALHVRSEKGWTPVSLPESPWAQPDHGPLKLEYVTTVGAETVVGTSRVEKIAGKKKPVTLRAVYSSVSHGEPARCGTPRSGELARK